MPTHSKAHEKESPFAILTELAVEGTASLVEAQRTFLDLVKKENAIFCNGVKERMSSFGPAVAATELTQRSVDTIIEMQEELLTNTSKQTLQWLESQKEGKATATTHLIDFAREGVETFTRAQKKVLEAIAEEAATATNNRAVHNAKPGKKTIVAQLAREAAQAFIEAQKRLLDVTGQQMNVTLDAATRGIGLVSPERFLPLATETSAGVKNFLESESSLFGSLIRPEKKSNKQSRNGRAHSRRKKETVPA